MGLVLVLLLLGGGGLAVGDVAALGWAVGGRGSRVRGLAAVGSGTAFVAAGVVVTPLPGVHHWAVVGFAMVVVVFILVIIVVFLLLLLVAVDVLRLQILPLEGLLMVHCSPLGVGVAVVGVHCVLPTVVPACVGLARLILLQERLNARKEGWNVVRSVCTCRHEVVRWISISILRNAWVDDEGLNTEWCATLTLGPADEHLIQPSKEACQVCLVTREWEDEKCAVGCAVREISCLDTSRNPSTHQAVRWKCLIGLPRTMGSTARLVEPVMVHEKTRRRLATNPGCVQCNKGRRGVRPGVDMIRKSKVKQNCGQAATLSLSIETVGRGAEVGI